MSISVEAYRIRIGYFEANTIRKMKSKKLCVKYGKIKQYAAFVLGIIILQLFGSCYAANIESIETGEEIKIYSGAQCTKNLQGRNYSIKTTFRVDTKFKEICSEEDLLYHWAQHLPSINKLQKIINGNRRSVGY